MNACTEWLAQFFDELTPHEFYRVIFPGGELDLGQSKFPYHLLHLRSLLPTTIPCFTHPSKPDLE